MFRRKREARLALSLIGACAIVGAFASEAAAASHPDTAAARSTQTTQRAQKQRKTLDPGAWNPAVHSKLVRLVERGRDKGNLVAFDWDDTSIARDIGFATFGQLVQDGKIVPTNGDLVSASPPYLAGGQAYSLPASGLLSYWKSLPSAAPSGNRAVQDSWEAQAYVGNTPADVVRAASAAYANGAGREDVGKTTVTTIASCECPRPFVYPEMADLYGYLLDRGYDVWIVSDSAAWIVRWMVRDVLNPMIREKWGARNQLPLDHVIGVSTHMIGKADGGLHSDPALAASRATGPAYLNSDLDLLDSFTLTTQLDLPVSDGPGKPAALFERVSFDRPYLVAGDSPEDFANLARAKHRLWIDRVTETEHQKDVAQSMRSFGARSTWLVQPTISTYSPGFVATKSKLDRRMRSLPATDKRVIRQSLRALTPTGWSAK